MRQIAHAAVVGVLVMSAGCGPKDTPAEQATPPTLPPATASAPPISSGPVVDFGEEGVFVEKASDAEKLTGTSADFKKFIADAATRLKQPPGTECEIGITVQLYDPSGFASGGVNECGGYLAIWGRKDGAWKELIGMQSVQPCSELKALEIPPTLIKECLDDKQPSEVVPYTG